MYTDWRPIDLPSGTTPRDRRHTCN